MEMKVFLGIFFLAYSCYSYPTGAPPEACGTLAPAHRVIVDGVPTSEIHQPQTGPSPYKLDAIKNPDNSITLTLSGDDFKGFVFRAFDGSGEPVDGQFEEKTGLRTINCDSIKDTVTHVDANDKSTFEFVWYPPTDVTGSVIFKGSVVKNYSTFWLIESEPVNY
ncbi:putative defense protein 3 [Centruroides vittatus]|uniref:putative defense protein 3 n=1 Tax=Centruroides vittatus TaxID=120091 RepID=UPI00350FDF22